MKRLLALLLLMPFLAPLTASAQTHWWKYDSNPMLDVGAPGTWDSFAAIVNQMLLQDQDNEYIMYYSGWNGNMWRIGRAEQIDGEWSRSIVMHPSLAWESSWTNFPHVIEDQDGFKMWYTGGFHTGYATSSDGITWTKNPDPVLSPGPLPWDNFGARFGSVLYVDGEYKMWYTGESQPNRAQIGYATSEDGIVWTKHPDNPVLARGETGSWDDWQVGFPRVIHNGQFYEMWYLGSRGTVFVGQTGYATSEDGVTWTTSPHNPVLVQGSAAWETDAVSPGEVHYREEFDHYLMWYYGDDGIRTRTGFAFSVPGTEVSISDEMVAVGDTLEISVSIPGYGYRPSFPSSELIQIMEPARATSDRFHGLRAEIVFDNEVVETIALIWDEGIWHNIFVPDQEGPHGINLRLTDGPNASPWATMHNAASFVVGTVGVPGETAGVPNLSVASVHPNPARAVVTIAYELPRPGPVTIEVFDVLGRRVALLEEGEKPAGAHEVLWDARTVAAGVYVVSLRAMGEKAAIRVTISP